MNKLYPATIFLLFLLLTLMLAACPPTPQTRTPKAVTQYTVADYFPLRVGDRWSYQIRFAGGQSIQREVRIVRRQGDVFYDNQQPPETYQHDPYGLRGRNRYLIKYPLRVGGRWLSVTSLTSVERYAIVDIDREVRVPAGTYQHCLLIRSRDSRGRDGVLEALFYFAPRIGLIKVTTTMEQGQKRIPQWTLELVAYLPAAS